MINTEKEWDHSTSKFYYDLETSETSNGERQEAIYDFINKEKGLNTRKKMVNDMKTLVH